MDPFVKAAGNPITLLGYSNEVGELLPTRRLECGPDPAPGALLADCGNLSSASILAVLQLAMREKLPLERSNDALVVAIGPGLSFELSLLEF